MEQELAANYQPVVLQLGIKTLWWSAYLRVLYYYSYDIGCYNPFSLLFVIHQRFGIQPSLCIRTCNVLFGFASPVCVTHSLPYFSQVYWTSFGKKKNYLVKFRKWLVTFQAGCETWSSGWKLYVWPLERYTLCKMCLQAPRQNVDFRQLGMRTGWMILWHSLWRLHLQCRWHS